MESNSVRIKNRDFENILNLFFFREETTDNYRPVFFNGSAERTQDTTGDYHQAPLTVLQSARSTERVTIPRLFNQSDKRQQQQQNVSTSTRVCFFVFDSNSQTWII